jgi:hypothetical protein
MRSHPEQALQRQIVGYLQWALAPPAMFTSFPAGGGGAARGKALKATGLKAGMPDIQIFYDGRVWLLELKTEKDAVHKVRKGVVSKVQEDTHKELLAAKQLVAVARSLDEFRALLAGPWWPLMACIRETKPATERIRRGMTALAAEKG